MNESAVKLNYSPSIS